MNPKQKQRIPIFNELNNYGWDFLKKNEKYLKLT